MATDALNTTQILAMMIRVHNENIGSSGRAEFSEDKLEAVFKEFNLTFRETVKKLTYEFIDIAAVTTITTEWKFMVANFYCLHLLHTEMKKDELLSVAQAKDLRNCVKTMVHVGILQNLNPKLPHFKPLRTNKVGIQSQYYMLKGTVCGLFKYAMLPTLRYHMLTHILEGLMVALFQLAYCPIKKPLSYVEDEFIMSEEFYGELLGDQDRFQGFLEAIQNAVSPMIYLKEIMILFRANSPNWFKKAVSATLTNCIKQNDGLENILRTMVAGVYDNNSTIWKVTEIITQIVVSCANSTDFKTCMRPQVDNLLKTAIESPGQEFIAFEKLYSSIVKAIYASNEEQAEFFLGNVFMPLTELSTESAHFNLRDQAPLLGKEIMQSVRVIHFIFLDAKDTSVPLNVLTPCISILFNIYVCICGSELISLKSDLHDVIFQYMKTLERPAANLLFENFLFSVTIPEMINFRQDIMITADASGLIIKPSEKSVKYEVVKRAHVVYDLCKSEIKLFYRYFGFLLNCLCDGDKYFPSTSLLESEDEGNLSTFEKKLAVCEMLTILSEDGWKKKYFTQNIPEEMFDYFNQVIVSAINTGSHKDSSNPMFQLVFTVAMILEDVVKTKQYDLNQLEIFSTLTTMSNETCNPELKALCKNILVDRSGSKPETAEKDEVQEIIEGTYNESIPMKGHSLIALKNLVSSRVQNAVERKQYIFTVFKENLSNRDTYIYQAAINGLATMSDLGTECTNMVLETLCEEYINFPKEEFGDNANEMRLKIGEVLVQISKKLGEMAPTYKALLLNTFLSGTKDEDHLVRASALANLGEICNVLGYKLGSIVTEVLVCVHAIISSDKHIEPRRAAVLVIRQLLAGLGTEMLLVLKDDILLIYRTLKSLYDNNNDDVLKLQTQLALEELNKNMKDLMFPQIEMDSDNKIVVLK